MLKPGELYNSVCIQDCKRETVRLACGENYLFPCLEKDYLQRTVEFPERTMSGERMGRTVRFLKGITVRFEYGDCQVENQD